ncbi:hypothetical protein MGLY_35330 (plasmid) [Neomoorella glycerini]|uniref:Uncharacterized protein n=1 Tax=Neomoorella glycerini TaxID=55779 RepID=A0A6I5ZWY9_9FIRM|nr:hypothetical protein [Moorella glycerini]QGP94108.1 hypothetical protein MGLY_35330 [Moorella glycerini]
MTALFGAGALLYLIFAAGISLFPDYSLYRYNTSITRIFLNGFFASFWLVLGAVFFDLMNYSFGPGQFGYGWLTVASGGLSAHYVACSSAGAKHCGIKFKEWARRFSAALPGMALGLIMGWLWGRVTGIL